MAKIQRTTLGIPKGLGVELFFQFPLNSRLSSHISQTALESPSLFDMRCSSLDIGGGVGSVPGGLLDQQN